MKRILTALLLAPIALAQVQTIPNTSFPAVRALMNSNFSWLNTNKASTSATLTINGVTITLGTANSITSSNITEGSNLYFTNARVLSATAGLYESPLTFSAPLSRSVNTISLTACADGEIHKYRTSTGWTCEADQTGAAGGGITTLNTLNGATQTFAKVDDTNVTLAIGSLGTTHTWTIGWSGLLAPSRGGTGASSTSQSYAFIGPTSGAGAPSFRALVAGDIPNLAATYAPVGHNHTGTYEPADATILKQVNLAGSGAATTPARSDHNHTGTYAASNATATVNGTTVTLGASATITANLPANPAACSAGQYVTDIAADGTLTCSAPAGSGTVTVVASGALTSTALVTGGGTTTLQTPAATATMDGSGNISTPGTVTATSFITAAGSVAGLAALPQGTANTPPANTVGIQAPTSVPTAFLFTLPSAPAAGYVKATNANPSVISVGAIAAADLPAALANSTSVNGTAIGASKTILYTDTAAGSFPTLNQNTSGTAANLSGTPALPNGTTATTQTAADNTTKLATTAYADAAAAARTGTIASGAKALNTAAIASTACDTMTATATGAASTDVVNWTPNADITAVTGYAPVTTGGLSIYMWPTANTVNIKVCNPTSSSITPGAVTLNWRIVR